MAGKHTPGPWLVTNLTDVFTQLGATNADGAAADSNDGWLLASCSNDWVMNDATELSSQEEMANAKLIATAPELLEVLREAYEYIDSLEFEYRVADYEARLADKMTSVIAKAEGNT